MKHKIILVNNYIKRETIKGFGFKLFGYYIELVFIKCILKVFAISKPMNKTIIRWSI